MSFVFLLLSWRRNCSALPRARSFAPSIHWGKAVVRCWKDRYQEPVPEPQDFAMLPGQGVNAQVEDMTVAAGNESSFAGDGDRIDGNG